MATFEAEKVKADAEAIIAVYRADAEATQIRAKEVANMAQARSYLVAEHANYQSRRETLEEVHTRAFDLAVDIENVKVLEAQAKALLSFDDDDFGSTSGSKSGGDSDDEDAVPEETQDFFELLCRILKDLCKYYHMYI